MTRSLAILLLVMAAALTGQAGHAAVNEPVAGPLAAPNAFIALSYHEVRDDVREFPDPYAVDAAALVRQFAWLRGNGYTPVNLDAIIAARAGGKPLPPKAVLLTFDDAYLSFYTRVYPLLREFKYPAVLAVVGKWIGAPAHQHAQYGEKSSIPDAQFPTWQQLREMADSGLVELASHTYDLHRGVPANPQGNLEPAATARIYDAASGTYEDDPAWRERVSADVAASAAIIERETGHRPRVIVWPYGSYNDELTRMAREWGMTIGLTLDDGVNTPEVAVTALRRTLAEHNPTLAEFVLEVRGPRYPAPVRAVQVNLDDVYSADAAQQERNLSLLLDRILILKPTQVYLQATADTDGDGVADMAYFPTRHLPMRGDLFNRAAWQLASRVDVKVFAVMPVSALHLPPAAVAEVYTDLARHAAFDGLVFDEAARPGDDAATANLTRDLTTAVRAFRAPLQTVRTMRLAPSIDAASRNKQEFTALAADYDYVALITTPECANNINPVDWLGASVDALTRQKAMFMLRSTPRISGSRDCNSLAGQMRALQQRGALNFGYLTDDFLHDNPPLAQIAPALSLREYPQTAAKAK